MGLFEYLLEFCAIWESVATELADSFVVDHELVEEKKEEEVEAEED